MKTILTLNVAALLLITSSCSGGDLPDKPSTEPANQETALVHLNLLTATNQTRSVADDAIKTVYVAFYKDGAYKGKALATQTGENYSVQVPTNESDRPDCMVAFVNMTADEVPTVSLSELSGKVTSRIFDEDGYMVMTSRGEYADATGVNFTVIDNDVITGAKSANIVVERLAAKVTANWSNPSITPIKGKVAQTNEERQLNLELTGWTVSATEKASYLLRNHAPVSGSDLTFTQWSQSLTWEKSLYPEYSSSVGEETPLYYVTYADVSNTSNTAAYHHETTRPAADYKKHNATPVLVLSGQYTLSDGSSPQTFYKYGDDEFFTEEEYWETMASAQKTLFKGGQRISGSELKDLVDQVHPGESYKGETLLKLQLKSGRTVDEFTDENGKTVTAETINDDLAKCPIMERFKDGKCYFVVPIRHIRYSAGLESQSLGAYGLVRNHSYTITVDGINGIGAAVGSDSQYLLQNDVENNVTSHQVTVTLTVADWDEVPGQNVTI